MAYRLQTVTSGFNGGPGYNNWFDAGNTQVDAETFAESVNTFFDTIKSQLANGTQVTFTGLVEQFDPTTGQTQGIRSVSGWSIQGTWGTAQLVQGATAVFQWRTGIYRNGREVRGRSFISGLGQIEDNDGDISVTALGVLAGAAADYAAGTTASVYSPTAGILYNMQSGSVRGKFGLVRSRRD